MAIFARGKRPIQRLQVADGDRLFDAKYAKAQMLIPGWVDYAELTPITKE